MKTLLTRLLSGLWVIVSASAVAVTRYVDLSSANPTLPYTNWSVAATSIQAAIDASVDGDLVLVADGNYATGSTNVNAWPSRIALNKAITVQSVNGPAVTRITGKYSNPAIRCAYVGSGAVLSGFTLTGGRGGDGGGAYCEPETPILTNCIVTGNYALSWGGGVFGGRIYNCTVSGNNATGFQNIEGIGGGLFGCTAHNCRISGNVAHNDGGGVYRSTLYNCLVDGNGRGAASSTLVSCTVVGNNQGGTTYCTVSNSIVYYNTPENNAASGVYFTCTTPVPTDGFGNFSSEPPFASDYRLFSNSPCINSGDNSVVAGSTDLDGNPRVVGGFLDLGAFEFQSAPFPSAYATVNYTNLVVGFAASFSAGYSWGRATTATWDFGDGTVVSNTLSPTHAWTSDGDYLVVAQVYAPNNVAGLSATVSVHVATQILYYVDAAGTNPIPPYSSWQTAATNIQDAVEVATPAPESLVLVTNGVYQFGGRVVHGAMTNRLAVTKPITIESINGQAVTVIQGYQSAGSIYGDSAIRCVYLTNNASLTGFTITGGATRMLGDTEKEQSGGGVWCESTNVNLVNCLVTGNSARWAGGGVFRGSLINCQLVGNRAEHNSGGGAKSARLSHCTLVDNSSGLNGGGADQSILDVCALLRNSATINGGGARGSTLKQCTLVANSAGISGGGVAGSALSNCIAYYNTARTDSNYLGGLLSYCCTTPPAAGSGNISNEPLITDNFHLASNSPCRGAGNPVDSVGLDMDGEQWLGLPAIGCDEYHTAAVAGPLEVAIRVAYTNVSAGLTQDYVGIISGRASLCVWDFEGGEALTNRPSVRRSYAVDGSYPIVLTAYNDNNPGGVSATVVVQVVSQPIHYVSLTSTNPVSPYFSWDTAATNIQDAIDVAFGGGVVLVSNGVYQTGGRTTSGFLTNRIAVDKLVSVQSVNGAKTTTINGNGPVGDGAVRCVYLSHDARLVGFTVAAGATQNSGDIIKEQSGGGVWCESTNVVLLNCVIVSNTAAQFGGGAYSGASSNCVFIANSAGTGGGAIGGILGACTVISNSASSGGGVSSNLLNNCILLGNKAGNSGGGAMGSTLNNCLIQANSALTGGGVYGGVATNCRIMGNLASGTGGGGAFQATVNNSTITANRATTGGGGGGSSCSFANCLISSNSAAFIASGVYICFLYNCTVVGHTNAYAVYGGTQKNSIVYYNAANFASGTFSSCCTIPLPSGSGNFTNIPAFVDLVAGDFHLQLNSPCINAGNNAFVTNFFDLETNARIQGATVDVGAYEIQGAGLSGFTGWLWQHGLRTDGSVDFSDSDNDRMNNWQEWIAGTDPTNVASVLRLNPPLVTPPGLQLRWSSQFGQAYFVQRATNLGGPLSFSLLRADILGLPDTTAYTDTTAPTLPAAFYRVGTGNSNGTTPPSLQAPAFVPASVTLTWSSVTNRSYSLERATDLGTLPVFSVLQSNIAGSPDTTSWTDTNAVGSAPCFYRVRVEN